MVERFRQWLNRLSPVQMLAVGFVSLIAVGTVLLLLPFSTKEGPLSLIDALFTATSAICVTGLIVVDTGSRFTPFGQGVILALIQFGGLAIMGTSTFVLLALGQRAFLRNLLMLRGEYTVSGMGSARRLLLTVGLFTLVMESVGAVILSHRFAQEMPVGRAVWLGVFHSVSAFCNAGFSLFSNSFMDYRADLTINLTIPLLIVLGGIGFPALIDVLTNVHARLKGERLHLSLHAKIVLTATGVLLLLGTLAFLLLNQPSMQGMPFKERITAAWFQSATTRTAGFNTIDFGSVTAPAALVTIVLMMIGGSPGSTAGGIKTTTFVVILVVVLARLRGHERVECGKRAIPAVVITKALVVAVLGVGVVIMATLLLLITDGTTMDVPQQHGVFVSSLFEIVSAFGTVGLSIISTAATGALTWMGKLVIICAMYFGRLGPLALAEMILAADRPLNYRYPEEYLLVG